MKDKFKIKCIDSNGILIPIYLSLNTAWNLINHKELKANLPLNLWKSFYPNTTNDPVPHFLKKIDLRITPQ